MGIRKINKALIMLLSLNGLNKKRIISKIKLLEESEFSIFDDNKIFYEIFGWNLIKEDMDNGIDYAEKVLLACEKKDIQIISYLSDLYPSSFKIIDNPPLILYIKGNSEILNNSKNIAVIGTRKPLDESNLIAKEWSRELTEEGYNIVSGLAIGCDTQAHVGAIEANGKTIAILPSGLLDIYPKNNKKLAKKIVEQNGCLISEYPPNTILKKYNFVERDRLQSALSDTVIIIESKDKGGTMHTVKFAYKYNKRIIAYYPKEDYIDKPEFSGNRYAIDKYDALPAKSINEAFEKLQNENYVRIKSEQLEFDI